ncbi:MAG TPA: hypothetical protein DCY13_10975 [Verrucomicrobiales bacterium]|nr:hypothetical protein [Verrucomicrobiales bacterium]
MKKKLAIAAATLALCGAPAAHAAPVDIAFVVDQSISMGPEFAWIPTVIGQIDTALAAETVVDSVRYGLAGYMEGAGNEFTSSPPAPNVGEYVGLAYVDFTSVLTDVTNAATAAGADLRFSTERGYHAADWSRSGFSWDPAAVKVMILLTDGKQTAGQRDQQHRPRHDHQTGPHQAWFTEEVHQPADQPALHEGRHQAAEGEEISDRRFSEEIPLRDDAVREGRLKHETVVAR